MPNFYCKHCGAKYSTLSTLLNSSCTRNPYGKRHELYEGSEKNEYVCKYCGAKYSTMTTLLNSSCTRNPYGRKHEAAL